MGFLNGKAFKRKAVSRPPNTGWDHVPLFWHILPSSQEISSVWALGGGEPVGESEGGKA